MGTITLYSNFMVGKMLPNNHIIRRFKKPFLISKGNSLFFINLVNISRVWLLHIGHQSILPKNNRTRSYYFRTTEIIFVYIKSNCQGKLGLQEEQDRSILWRFLTKMIRNKICQNNSQICIQSLATIHVVFNVFVKRLS